MTAAAPMLMPTPTSEPLRLSPSKRPQFNVRLSPEGEEVLDRLRQHFNIPMASLVELAFRTLARKEGLKVPPAKRPRRRGARSQQSQQQ